MAHNIPPPEPLDLTEGVAKKQLESLEESLVEL